MSNRVVGMPEERNNVPCRTVSEEIPFCVRRPPVGLGLSSVHVGERSVGHLYSSTQMADFSRFLRILLCRSDAHLLLVSPDCSLFLLLADNMVPTQHVVQAARLIAASPDLSGESSSDREVYEFEWANPR